jgi:predicted peroxiredoxin
MADPQRLLFMMTHGPDDPELAIMPVAMAVGALRSGRRVAVGLQGPAVDLAVGGRVDRVAAAGFAPLGDLLAEFERLGGRLLVCPASATGRGINPAADLVAGAEMVVPGGFFTEMDAVDRVLFY